MWGPRFSSFTRLRSSEIEGVKVRKERRMWSEWVLAIAQRGTQMTIWGGACRVNDLNEMRVLKDVLGQWHPWMDYWGP